MKKIKSLLFSALLSLIFITLAACTTENITCTADELKNFAWSNSDDFGKSIELRFDGNTGFLKIKSKDEAYEIKGDVIADDNNLTITDSTLKDTYEFTYKLYGDKIELTYGENTLTLNKVKS